MTKRILYSAGAEALAREGLQEQPQAWEDGLRAKPQVGNFEWWYFDAQLSNGATAAVTFFTKPLLDRQSVLKPGVNITILKPDGQVINDMALIPPEEFSASKEKCYIRMGESFARGNLQEYELHARVGELLVSLNFSAVAPAWRPLGTGKFYFDEAKTRYFAWLPVMPYGTVSGQIICDGKMCSVKGIGYHEHTWGNVCLTESIAQYYRGHAHLGEYSLVFGEIKTGQEEETVKVLMVSKGTQVLINTNESLELEEIDFVPDEGGRSYPEKLELRWEKDTEYARLKLSNPRITDAVSLMDLLPLRQKLFQKIATNPFHFRIQSEIDLQLQLAGQHNRAQGTALYELMQLA